MIATLTPIGKANHFPECDSLYLPHSLTDYEQLMTYIFSCLYYYITGISGNTVELAYGTDHGTVNIIIQHPETVGRGPQLFQTFSVHRCAVAHVHLSDKHLLSGMNLTG